MSIPELPVIDLSPLWNSSSDGLSKVAKEFISAFQENSLGFAYVINHRVPQSIIKRVFDQHRRFHSLPLQEKNKIRLNQWHRGYLPLAAYKEGESESKGIKTEDTKSIKSPNQSESFIMNHEHLEGPPDVKEEELFDRYLQGPNQWPHGMPDFREDVLAYYHELSKLALELTKVFFAASETDFNRFAPHFQRPSVAVRMLHYPPQPLPVPEGVFGSAPHCDHGFLTLLAILDNVGGLEIKTSNGEWISVPSLVTSNNEFPFIVNLGDLSAKWTNDYLKAIPHRVINRSGVDRYSIVFFWDPQFDFPIDTRDLGTKWCPADKKPNYEPQPYGQYLKHLLGQNYVDLYKTIPASK